MSDTDKIEGRPLTTLWERPGYLIRRLHQIHVAIFLEECADHGITPVQYAVMTALLTHPGADQVTIAREAAIDRTSVADVLNRLARRGLVHRKPGKKDRRKRIAVLTEEGKGIARNMEHASLAAQIKFIAPLPPAKREQLMELMTELVEANNQCSRAPARNLTYSRGQNRAAK